jgi:hypothetical protein
MSKLSLIEIKIKIILMLKGKIKSRENFKKLFK